MTEVELGRVLGDALGGLDDAFSGTVSAMGLISQVDGKTIVSEGTHNDLANEQLRITAAEFRQLIGDALSELESVVSQVEDAMDQLWSIDDMGLWEESATVCENRPQGD